MHNAGDYSEGIRLVSRRLVVNPNFAEAPINLGRMHAKCTTASNALWMGLPVHIEAAYAQMWERSQRGERAYRIRR